MRDRSAAASGLLLCCLALFSACAPSTSQVERGLERELPRVIGPAEHYDVEIEGLRARSGEAARVVALGERVRPADAPVVDRLEVELRNVRYDRRGKRLERFESAVATARITAADLGAFLETQPNIESAAVTLTEPDQASVRVRPKLGGLALPPGVTLDVVGRLVGAGDEIRFEVSEVRAGGASLGSGIVRQIGAMINPLIDLGDLPVVVDITRVQVEQGALRLEATGEAIGLRR